MSSQAQRCVDVWPAAPIVRISRSALPSGAAAYTDGISIFMPHGVGDADTRTIIRHESAHIWLRHFARRGERQPQTWAMACEMEIARSIYDAKDISTISDRYSTLHHGFTADSIPECPASLKLAEEIYDWLIAQAPPNIIIRGCACCNQAGDATRPEPGASGGRQAVNAKVGAADAVASARSQLDTAERQERLQRGVAKAVRHRAPPSLAADVEALYRAAYTRPKSYMRPARRESGFLDKGRIGKLAAPKIQIYVDRSGSFSPQKTMEAEQRLKTITAKFAARVKADVFCFGNDSLVHGELPGGGNTPYHLVVNHINETRPEIAVVITDDDDAMGCGVILTKTICWVVPVGCAATSFGVNTGAKQWL